MFVACPSCGKRISDRVPACPFCRASTQPEGAITPPAAEGARAVSTPPRRQPARRSPLAYVLAGCGGLMMLGVVAGGVGVFLFRRKLDEWKRHADDTMEEQRTNPALRTANATRMLHAERLPDGYFAAASMSVAGMEDVVLGDEPPHPTGEFSSPRDRAFVYSHKSLLGLQSRRIRAFVVGDTDDPSAVRAGPFTIATNAIVRRGMMNLGGQTVLYCAQRGEMSIRDVHRLGLQTVSLIDCPEDRDLRLAIWVGPDPSPGTPVAQFDVTGTVADEKELRSFLSNFKVCEAGH